MSRIVRIVEPPLSSQPVSSFFIGGGMSLAAAKRLKRSLAGKSQQKSGRDRGIR
jgi:hypothetical protein